MAGYLPNGDTQFKEWADRFLAYVDTHSVELGLAPADLLPLIDGSTEWNTDYAANADAQTAARAARIKKDESRTGLEEVVRPMVKRIQAWPGTTDEAREAMGITVQGASSSITVSGLLVSDDRPMATIDVSNRLKHVMKFQNQTSLGVRSGKPSGTVGCEVWRKVGENPSGPGEMQLVGLALRASYVIEYVDGDGGKTAHYALRWVNSKDEKGSWSETASATIAA